MIKKVINDANEERLRVIKRMAMMKRYDEDYAKKLSQTIVRKIDQTYENQNKDEIDENKIRKSI